jgi:hypothetical protein
MEREGKHQNLRGTMQRHLKDLMIPAKTRTGQKLSLVSTISNNNKNDIYGMLISIA